MPSTYTTNLGIEKIGTGEQSGTWGTTTNTNFDLIDQGVNGIVQVTLAAVGSTGSPNALTVDNGAVSDGRNKFIEFVDGGDLGGTAYVQLQPNDAEKVAFIRNSLSGSRSIIIFQGTYNASNDFEIPNGADVVLKFDGAGASATVTQVFENLTVSSATLASGVTVNAILDEDNMASDSDTALATQQSIKAYVDSQVGTVDTLAEVLANGNTSGATDLVIDSGQVLTTNTINETTAASGVTIDSVLLKDDGVNATNLEITNLKANDGTSAGSIANSTGVVTLASSVLTTTDINGGTIDGTVIGGSSAAAGSFTTISASGEIAANGGVAFGDNDKATFGASDDLQIYHDGSHSYIDEQGAGRIHVRSDNGVWFYNGDSTEVSAKLNIDGACEFRYDNAIKLATTATGIDVTGTVTLGSGNLIDWSTASSSSSIKGYGSYAQAVQIELDKSDFYPQASFFKVTYGSSDKNLLQVDNSGDISFYEDTGTTAKFFWDASAESLGIGTASPSYTLSLRNDSAISYPLSLESSTLGTIGNTVGMLFGYSGNTYKKGAIIFESLDANARGKMHFALDDSAGSGNVQLSDAKMTIDYSGNVGIGTTSPASALHVVKGTGTSTYVRTSDGTVTSLAGVAPALGGGLIGTTSNHPMLFYANNAERMRISSAGNVGIGTGSITNPYSQSNFTNVNIDGVWGGVISFKLGGTEKGWIGQRSSGNSDMVVGASSGQNLLFATNGNNERARIDSSGNLLIGTTAFFGNGISISKPDVSGVYSTNSGTASTFHYRFANGNGAVGSIVTNGSTTTYNITSDQRLKDNIVDAPSSSDDIDAIQVRSFDWKADGSHQKYGMIAQELMTVAPEAVSGDPESDEMMGVDYSKLVPMLVKEIQSLRARVAQLETN